MLFINYLCDNNQFNRDIAQVAISMSIFEILNKKEEGICGVVRFIDLSDTDTGKIISMDIELEEGSRVFQVTSRDLPVGHQIKLTCAGDNVIISPDKYGIISPKNFYNETLSNKMTETVKDKTHINC